MLNISQFNWVDWAILAVVALSTLISLWRGFAREALSLAGWVAAFLIANMYAARMAPLLSGMTDNPTIRFVAGFALLFVATLLVTGVVVMLAKQLIRMTGLGTLDRLLGTVFGVARGLILIVVAVFLAEQLLPPEEQDWLYQSQLMPQVDMLVIWMQELFHEVRDGQLMVFLTGHGEVMT